MPSVIPAVSRTLAVFEVFARERRELSNSEMARHLSLAESSCSDLLHTLHTLGYLNRTPRSRRFYPSARLHQVARQVTENDAFLTLAREAVDQLAERTNESAFFGVLDRHAAKIAAAQPSRLPLRYILDVGERVALNASALGKALLGALPAPALTAELEQLRLRAVTSDTVVRIDTLAQQLEKSRDAGWYETRGEGIEGVRALAVSGWLNEQPVALSLAGPTERMDRNHDIYLRALRESSSALLADHETTT
ncbi:IclR family transcriptional regulator [Variovorax sp. J22P168]|uniref:IclR family transcriptional regulator n=1 Tax=Variovorax jilinensis TaxID=3053513 RepID=UPI0025786F90|nr:IclR family transcriptional regulator [Variovorax sp. J22P168]MDM0015346.1 IclR family transcriptional regulator [Variovorax sp. J22P168]